MKRRTSYEGRGMRSPYLSPWYIAWCFTMGILIGLIVMVIL